MVAPDFEGILFIPEPGTDGPGRTDLTRGRTVRISVWVAGAEPTAEHTWRAHCRIEGDPTHGERTAVFGSTPFQATSQAFRVVLDYEQAQERAFYVLEEELDPPD